MKKTALTLLLIFTLLFSSAELVKMAEANFMWTHANVEPVPGTIPPSISINNPKNNTSYFSNMVTLNFSVRTAELNGWSSFITDVEYSLDGSNLIPVDKGSDLLELFKFRAVLTSLPSGKHSLTVRAEVVVYRSVPAEKFLLDANSTVFFSMGSADYFPTPTPIEEISPLPTINTGPSPYYFDGFLIGGIAGAVAIAVLVLLYYFTKRK